MKIYTGFGDEGQTRLYGGKVVSKDHLRIEVYGTIDELNSWLGFVSTYSLAKNISENLLNIQNDLFCLSSELAAPTDYKGKKFFQRISHSDIKRLEQLIDIMEIELTPLKNFILPIRPIILRSPERWHGRFLKNFEIETIQNSVELLSNVVYGIRRRSVFQ